MLKRKMTTRFLILSVSLCLIGIFGTFTQAVQAQAATHNVKTTAQLIDAITNMVDDDIINFTANITLDAVDNTTDGPNGLPLITQNNIIIEGNGFTLARAGSAPDFRLLYVDTGSSVTINNLTITGGLLTTSPVFGAGSGSGIYNSGTLTLANSTVSLNRATSSAGIGGGINNDNGAMLTVNNSTFSDNSARVGGGINNNNGAMLTVNNSTFSSNFASNGGGINNSNGAMLTVNNSTFSGNTATRGGGIHTNGGAIAYGGAITTVNNSTFSGNTATDGGGIASYYINTTVTINNSIISGNTAINGGFGGGKGGGIHNGGAVVTLNNSTVSDNTASTNGGGIGNYNDGQTTVNNSTVSSNTSNDEGGGIYTEAATSTLNNSTISGNTATTNGGGIFAFIQFSPVNINNSTIYGNAASNGGGIYNEEDVTLNNSIIANSTSGGDFDGPLPTVQGTNIVQDSTLTGAGIINADPLLDALQDNGGPTQTHAILNVGSPAFNATTGTATSNDQRGVPAVNTRDIGAFEYDGILPTVSFTVDETTLTEGGVITQATVTITVADFVQNFDVSFAFTGSASMDDYTTIYSGPYTITGNGDTTFTIDIFDDALVERSEDLDLTLLLQGVADILDPASQTIQLVSDDVLPQPPANDPEPSVPDVGVFDPALSKIGFLVPGEVGITGEQLEWMVTITNNGSAAGINVTMVDDVDLRLQINSVEAPGATVDIRGNIVTVMYPTLNAGESVQLSIFTTVLDGVSIDNTVCLLGTNVCATGSAVIQLPSTGETPIWRIPMLIGLLLSATVLTWIIKRSVMVQRQLW